MSFIPGCTTPPDRAVSSFAVRCLEDRFLVFRTADNNHRLKVAGEPH
ncbi:MAG: DUF1945 domain-containing protein [Saprospiraceae bacterium]|nr:DUF1945 domain-containing protein [Saprospiraceae bacterium]